MILAVKYVPAMYATVWALVPPVVAIVLALITKEVYSSLFVGIVIGGLFYGNVFQSGFSAERSVLHIFEDGLVGVLSDPDNVGILIFFSRARCHGEHDEQGRRLGGLWRMGG